MSQVKNFFSHVWVVYGKLKHKLGVEWVQHLLATESQGWVHRSTATLAIIADRSW
jgi:protein subunit release factor A